MDKRTLKRVIAMLIAMLALCAAGLAEQVAVVTATDNAAVYDAHGVRLGALPAGTALTVTGVKGSVCRVEKGGRTAYMLKSDLKQAETAATRDEGAESEGKRVAAYVSKDGAKVYNAKGKPIGSLSINTQVTVTAVKGKACRVTLNGKTAYMRKADLSAGRAGGGEETAAGSGSAATPATGTAKEMDWWTSDIQKIFARGTVARITDVETGIAWREMRCGGTNHADCQPLTPADTAAMKRAVGGQWSWNRRAIFVTIDGVNYAASMNGMPHGGGETIPDNDFPGHHCIHFTNSRLHSNDKVDAKHQQAVQKAAAATLR